MNDATLHAIVEAFRSHDADHLNALVAFCQENSDNSELTDRFVIGALDLASDSQSRVLMVTFLRHCRCELSQDHIFSLFSIFGESDIVLIESVAILLAGSITPTTLPTLLPLPDSFRLGVFVTLLHLDRSIEPPPLVVQFLTESFSFENDPWLASLNARAISALPPLSPAVQEFVLAAFAIQLPLELFPIHCELIGAIQKADEGPFKKLMSVSRSWLS
jgi:hypothetical protein